jgi:hypothetical protein
MSTFTARRNARRVTLPAVVEAPTLGAAPRAVAAALALLLVTLGMSGWAATDRPSQPGASQTVITTAA